METHTFFCIDAHTCGNPVRVVAGGAPALDGNSASARRRLFIERYDWIRTGLMFEPRGHDMMSGSILYPPTRETAIPASSSSRPAAACPCAGTARSGPSRSRSSGAWSAPSLPGYPAPRHAGRRRRSGVWARQFRPCRRRPHPQRRVLPGRRRRHRYLPRDGRVDGRHRLRRELLRHRGAAARIPRHGRPDARRHPAPQPPTPQRAQ